MNGKPETGLKLDNTFGSRGVITACLKDEGTIPYSFMIAVIGIIRLSMLSLRIEVGSGSRQQDLEGDDIIISLTWVRETV